MKINPTDYFRKTETDKIGHRHYYGTVYDFVMASLYHINGDHPLRVLEIGASHFHVGSGHAFCQMPFVEKYVGIDIKDLQAPFPEKGFFIKADAYREETLLEVSRHGTFHLLIDDGTHKYEDQIYFFKKYQRFCAPNGIMICEDVENNPGAINRRLEEINDKSLLTLTVPTTAGLDNVILLKWNT